MAKNILFILFFISIVTISFSQGKKDSSIFIPAIAVTYSYQIPGGDLATRYGNNSTIGSEFILKFKSNWLLGVDVHYIFGSDLKHEASSIFDSILTSNGEIINKEGSYARYLISERGFYAGAKAGRLFVIDKSNPNSGIIVTFAGGLLQHKIRIENDNSDSPQILGDKKKGYDKLTNGFCANEFIGYMYFGKKKVANFVVGFDFYQAWTQSRRDYDFNTMSRDTKKRHDYLYSLKFGWFIPFSKKTPKDYYYY